MSGHTPGSNSCQECGHDMVHHLPRRKGEHACCFVVNNGWCPCKGNPDTIGEDCDCNEGWGPSVGCLRCHGSGIASVQP